MKSRSLLGVVFLLASLAQAAAGEGDWHARCELAGHTLRLSFVAASGDADQADMNVNVQVNGGSAMQLPLAKGYYRPRGVVANQPSLCDRVGAFLLQDQVHLAEPPRLLLWLSVDDRPGWDLLSLVLLDLEAGRLLDHSERIAPIKDPDGRQRLALRIYPDHVLTRLQRRWLHDTGTDSAENSIEDWYRVEIRAGQIRGRWGD